MSLKHMILGCLMNRPLHGYAIKQFFLKRAQGINEGQMYTLFKQMEKEELVSSTWEENDEGRPPRKVYSLTGNGKEAFRNWVTSKEENRQVIPFDFFQHDPFLKKLTFFQHLEQEQVEELLKAEIERSKQKIAEFRRVRKSMIEKEVPFFSLEIIGYAIEKERLRQNWLEELLGKIRESEQDNFYPVKKDKGGSKNSVNNIPV